MSKTKETICWICKRPGTGTCGWDKRLEPVPGWVAKERGYQEKYYGKDSKTYLVEDCPLFVMDESVGSEHRMLSMMLSGMSDAQIAKETVSARKKVRLARIKFMRNGLLY